MSGHDARLLARSHSRDTITVLYPERTPGCLPGDVRDTMGRRRRPLGNTVPFATACPPRHPVLSEADCSQRFSQTGIVTIFSTISRSRSTVPHVSLVLSSLEKFVSPSWNRDARRIENTSIIHHDELKLYARVPRQVLFRCKIGRTYY